MQGGAIEIYVGPNKKLYTIPRALLCHHSGYFQSCLNSNFIEAAEGVVDFSSYDLETFVLLLEWMYKGNLRVFEDNCWEVQDLQAALKQTCQILCKLSCMADKLAMAEIDDYIVSQLDRVFRSAGDIFPMDSANVMAVYNNTHEHSELQKYVTKKLSLSLLSPTGHDIAMYAECIQGPDAIPGLAVRLIAKMKDYRSNDFWCKNIS